MARQNSEFYNIDFTNGIIEITIEVLNNEFYKAKKVTFRLDRDIRPWKFVGFVEGEKIEVPVPTNALHNENIERINLPENVSASSEKRIISALKEFLDRQLG